MTEKTLKERLPVGSPRNKVEYLAEEFEKTANDLYGRLQDKAVNLLSNPNFTEFLTKYRPSTVEANTLTTTSNVPDISRGTKNGRGSTLLAPYWAVDHQVDEYLSFNHYIQRGGDEIKPHLNPECGELHLSGDTTLYQILNIPLGGSLHNEVKARVSLFNLSPGTKITVGVRDINLEYKGPFLDGNVFHWSETIEYNDEFVADTPKTFDFEPFFVGYYGWWFNPTKVFYIRIENPSSRRCAIESAQLWHSKIYGDSPGDFTHNHAPNAYYDFPAESPIDDFYDLPIELLGNNKIRFSRSRPIDAPYGLLHHMIFTGERYDSEFRVLEIDPLSVTIQINSEQYEHYREHGDHILYCCQYSKMPVGLGFYE
ncbi:hypothetical protein ACQKPX_10320 [Photobacterium sp. DNB23_23_1]